MSLIRKHVAVLQAWACLALVEIWARTWQTNKRTRIAA